MCIIPNSKVANAMPFFGDIHAQYRYYSLSLSLLINTSTYPDTPDLFKNYHEVRIMDCEE